MRIVFLILCTISLIASSIISFFIPSMINDKIIDPLKALKQLGVPSSELPASEGLWMFISYLFYALCLGLILYVVQVYRKKCSTALAAILLVAGLILAFITNKQLATERRPLEMLVVIALPLVLTIIFGFLAQKMIKPKNA